MQGPSKHNTRLTSSDVCKDIRSMAFTEAWCQVHLGSLIRDLEQNVYLLSAQLRALFFALSRFKAARPARRPEHWYPLWCLVTLSVVISATHVLLYDVRSPVGRGAAYAYYRLGKTEVHRALRAMRLGLSSADAGASASLYVYMMLYVRSRRPVYRFVQFCD